MATRTGRPVDSQRQKVYDSEWKLQWSDKAAASLTIEQAQDEASRACAWLRSKGYDVPAWDARVKAKRGKGSDAWWRTGEIRFGQGHPYRWILLHEVAHLVNLRPLTADWSTPDLRAHGAGFTMVYLALVRHFLGVKDHDALKAAFKAHGAKYRPPRAKRQLTDEQRAALGARLAEHRKPVSAERWAYTRTVATPDGDVVMYVSSRVQDCYRWSEPPTLRDGEVWSTGRTHYEYGTRDPERAFTRTTVERLADGARKNWLHMNDDEGWVPVDIGPLLTSLTADREAVAAAAAQETRDRLRSEILAQLDTADNDTLAATLRTLAKV